MFLSTIYRHTNRYLDDFLYYGGKPKRIDLTASYGSKRGDDANIEYSFKNIYGISFYKFWCDIGKYDTPIFIGIIILTTIFIVLFIIDLFIKKDNISNGIIYYIIVILYMILYIVLRIFICLIFCFLVYSIVVTSSTPNFEIEHNSSLITYTNSYLDYNYKYSYNNINYEFAPPETIWNLKRTYAIISTASVFFIFIFVSILDQFKFIIIKYLGLNFEENIKKEEIKRNISIRFDDEIHEIEIKNRKDIYLD